MNKIFKIADIRNLEKQVSLGQISFSRMLELINEMEVALAEHPIEESVLPLQRVRKCCNAMCDNDTVGESVYCEFHKSL